MKFQQLSYFLAVVNELNFTKAAQNLYITQQTLSSHIASLEKELGTPLFERTTPLTLTTAGKIFDSYARRMTMNQKDMLRKIESLKEKKQLRIGVSFNVGALILHKILPAVTRECPGIVVNVLEQNRNELLKALKQNKIDFLIEHIPPGTEEIVTTPLLESKCCLLVSETYLRNTFGERADAIKEKLVESGRLYAFADCHFLLNKRGSSIRSAVEAVFMEEGIQPHIAVETENMETLLNLCSNHVGIAICPQILLSTNLRSMLLDNVHVFPLSYVQAAYSLEIGYRKNEMLPATAQKIINMTKSIIV